MAEENSNATGSENSGSNQNQQQSTNQTPNGGNEDEQAAAALNNAANNENGSDKGNGAEDRSSWTTEQWQAEIDKWKSHSRKNEKDAKANAAAATELEKIKESQKTEQQKLQDRLDKQEVELQGFRVSQTRREAAAKVGLNDPQLVEFITATDPDEAEQQAKLLVSKFSAMNSGNANGNAGPAANFGQGNRQAPPKDADPNTALRRAFGRG